MSNFRGEKLKRKKKSFILSMSAPVHIIVVVAFALQQLFDAHAATFKPANKRIKWYLVKRKLDTLLQCIHIISADGPYFNVLQSHLTIIQKRVTSRTEVVLLNFRMDVLCICQVIFQRPQCILRTEASTK